MFKTTWPISLMRPLFSRFPCISALYRSVRDQMDFMEEPKATPWGFKLAGNAAMAQGTFEPVETELVRNVLQDVDILVNVGANIGYYCCHALSMGKSVIAFEPIERNLRYLCKNIKTNGWFGTQVYPIALSNSVGVLDIYGGNTGASIVKGWAGIPESYVSLVPTSTMDVVLATRLQGEKVLIVVDIEGGEKRMLEGATIMLANNPKPIWLVEIVTKDNQPSGVDINPDFKSTFQLFFQNGYQAFSVDRDMRPITMEYLDLVSKGIIELNTYNFLFREVNQE
ncbi:MAG: FkbM family methyltransferase [Syntrophus sp. (in: bacteria)]